MSKAEDFSVIGKRVQRVEGFDKVTGDSEYIADIYLPGMLVGKVLRSPYPHAIPRRRALSTSDRKRPFVLQTLSLLPSCPRPSTMGVYCVCSVAPLVHLTHDTSTLGL